MSTLADRSTLRLTMILSGAISLGAYEAGVVSQLAFALDGWNAARPAGPPLVVIDMISGASAGAMTGAMLAAHIMQGGDPEGFVRANLDTWCGPDLSFDTQVQTGRADRHSFLSSSRIDAVAARDFQPAGPDPVRVRQSELIFTCTVTSLDPIPFQYQAVGGQVKDGEYQSFRMLGVTQRDWVTFSITGDAADPVRELPHSATRASAPADHAASWDRLRWFALASGAFPAAWQPVVMSRHPGDYPSPWHDLEAGEGNGIRLRYSDGGTLDNLPLDRAADALQNMEGWDPDEDRAYVLIQPDPTPPSYEAQVGPFQEGGVRDADTSLSHVLGAVYQALREQSFDKDLYGSQKVNHRLRARDRLFPRLVAVAVQADPPAGAPPEQVAAATAAVRQQLDDYLDDKGSALSAAQALERYLGRQRAGGEVAAALAKVPEPRRDLFKYTMALVDHIADLDGKGPVRIERVFPPVADSLAGRKLGHFGGFLRSDLMRHDFLCGLRDALVWLDDLAGRRGWPAPVSAMTEMGLQVDPAVAKLAATPWEGLPEDLKQHFFGLVLGRAADFAAAELAAGWAGRKSLEAAAHLVEVYLKFTHKD